MSMLFSLLITVVGAGNLGSGERMDSRDFEVTQGRVTTAEVELGTAEFIPRWRRFASPAWTFSALSGLGCGLYSGIRR